MKILRFILSLSLASLVLSLTIGVNVYSVHCKMRNADFISLQAGNDPCLIEKEASCCSKETLCLSEKESHSNNGCCNEKSIHISYEPDHFSQISIQVPQYDFLPISFEYSLITKPEVSEKLAFAAYPQPPPLSSSQRRAFTQIWRI